MQRAHTIESLVLVAMASSAASAQELDPDRLALHFLAPGGQGKALWSAIEACTGLAGAEFARLPSFQPEHMKPVPRSSFEVRYREDDPDGKRAAEQLCRLLRGPADSIGKGLARSIRRWPPTLRAVSASAVPESGRAKIPLVLVFTRKVPQERVEEKEEKVDGLPAFEPLPLTDIAVQFSVAPGVSSRLTKRFTEEFAGVAFAAEREVLYPAFKVPAPKAKVELRYLQGDLDSQRAAQTLLARLKGSEGELKTPLGRWLGSEPPALRPIEAWPAPSRAERRGRVEVVLCPNLPKAAEIDGEVATFSFAKISVQLAAPRQKGQRLFGSIKRLAVLAEHDVPVSGPLECARDAFEPSLGKRIEVRYLERDGADGKRAAQALLDLMLGKRGEIAGLSPKVRGYGAQVRVVDDWAGLHVVRGRIPLLVAFVPRLDR